MKIFKKMFICSLALLLGTISACNQTASSSEKSTSKNQTTEQSKVVESNASTTSSSSQFTTSSFASSSSKSSSVSSAPSSVISSSSPISSSSIHVHNYGQLHSGYLPSYYYDGMKPYYYCIECGEYFDENKNPTTEEALKLPRATDEIAFLIDDHQKDIFTLVEKDATHASWKIENRGVSKHSTVAIAKPGDESYRYAFLNGDGIDDFNYITFDGIVDVLLTATIDGFVLSFVENLGLYVKTNAAEYPLTKVNYVENGPETCIFGYHTFTAGEKMTVINKHSNKTYGYSDLEKDTKWNKFDFHEGTDGEIVFDKTARYGIEFNRNGDELIAITKVFGPASEGRFEVDFTGERESEEFKSSDMGNDNSQILEMMWYLNHEAVTNAEDIKNYLSKNKFYFYYAFVSFHANEEFSIKNLSTNKIISSEHLIGVFSEREDILTLDGDNIKMLKDGTYEIGYVSCCDSIIVYEMSDNITDAMAIVNSEIISLEKDSNNNVTYTFDANENSTVSFLAPDYSFLPFTFAEGTDLGKFTSFTSNGMTVLLIMVECTLTFTYNLDTHVLSLEYTLRKPFGDFQYYLSGLATLSGMNNFYQHLYIEDGTTVAIAEGIVFPQDTLLIVQEYNVETHESTYYSTLSAKSTPGVATYYTLGGITYIRILSYDSYNVSFDLLTKELTIVTATN